MKRLGMVLLGLMFWSMNTLAQDARPSDPDEPCYIGKANAYGKYSELVQRLDCHDDHERYGKGREYYDDEYWHGGEHCGNKGMNGYWVYVSPTWFVWERRRYVRHDEGPMMDSHDEWMCAEYEDSDLDLGINELTRFICTATDYDLGKSLLKWGDVSVCRERNDAHDDPRAYKYEHRRSNESTIRHYNWHGPR